MNDRERAIGERLRRFREDVLHWSQAYLAEHVGVSKDQLASVEYGRTPVRFGFAITFCEHFDLSPEWLVAGIEDQLAIDPRDPRFQSLKKTESRKQLTEVYDAFPDCFRAKDSDPKAAFTWHNRKIEEDPKSWLIKQVLRWFETGKFKDREDASNFAVHMDIFADEQLALIKQVRQAKKLYRRRSNQKSG